MEVSSLTTSQVADAHLKRKQSLSGAEHISPGLRAGGVALKAALRVQPAPIHTNIHQYTNTQEHFVPSTYTYTYTYTYMHMGDACTSSHRSRSAGVVANTPSPLRWPDGFSRLRYQALHSFFCNQLAFARLVIRRAVQGALGAAARRHIGCQACTQRRPSGQEAHDSVHCVIFFLILVS